MRFKRQPRFRTSYENPAYLHDIGAGRLPLHDPLYIAGHNHNVGPWYELVWPAGGTYTWLTAVDTLQVRSNEAQDTILGTGARTIRVHGLDADWAEITEDFEMAGAAWAVGTTEFLRIQNVEVLTYGTQQYNTGNISVYNSTLASLLGYIPSFHSISLSARWAVPAGKDLYITRWYGAESNNEHVEYVLYIRETDVTNIWQMRDCIFVKNKELIKVYDAPRKIPALSDIAILAYADEEATGSETATCCAGFQGWYESS